MGFVVRRRGGRGGRPERRVKSGPPAPTPARHPAPPSGKTGHQTILLACCMVNVGRPASGRRHLRRAQLQWYRGLLVAHQADDSPRRAEPADRSRVPFWLRRQHCRRLQCDFRRVWWGDLGGFRGRSRSLRTGPAVVQATTTHHARPSRSHSAAGSPARHRTSAEPRPCAPAAAMSSPAPASSRCRWDSCPAPGGTAPRPP